MNNQLYRYHNTLKEMYSLRFSVSIRKRHWNLLELFHWHFSMFGLPFRVWIHTKYTRYGNIVVRTQLKFNVTIERAQFVIYCRRDWSRCKAKTSELPYILMELSLCAAMSYPTRFETTPNGNFWCEIVVVRLQLR